ncbi:amidohydrolase family protein [Micromonospora endophytica]|uniref:Cytosine deaminase n=1 Tax=Micromonospora endophytica TaxID=515350 RepID=A0A2W2CDQ0_9ACTN|nr:amidohydrolase family protein [Micromonospora endophytica]PZF89938.1 cytosine deaminase [Micromonospora endophytica]RIW47021.1 cytosine deaminase [Micromonospora endophytica]BCJ60946.1 cytosine deaminase [Micromonospora endophytica]
MTGPQGSTEPEHLSNAGTPLFDDCGRPVPTHLIGRRTLLAAAGAAATGTLLTGASAAAASPGPHTPSKSVRRPERGHYLITSAALVSVDPTIGNQARADIEIKDGRIVQVGSNLKVRGAKTIDASRMIAMPGFVETHYHMWSALGRNFVSTGFEYFAAKSATVAAYQPDDFYHSVLLGLVECASAGITTVNNWAHNVRGPAYADAELHAHADGLVRARYSYGHRDGQPATQLIDFADIDRVRGTWFGPKSPFDGLVHLGVNLRGPGTPATFLAEMTEVRKRKLPVSVHSGQGPTTAVRAADLEQQGFLGPDFLLCHALPFDEADRQAMVRTGAPVSFSVHSELRLGTAGGFHGQLLRMLAAGITVSLSFDASSLAPINMFESMNVAWNLGIPWIGSDTASLPPVVFKQAIEMATINGAKALGLDQVTGSITPGKRADIILIRADDLNIAPLGDLESTVVRSATPANIDTVFIDGRIVKRNRAMVSHDTDKVVRNAAAAAHAVRTRAGGILTPTTTTPPKF